MRRAILGCAAVAMLLAQPAAADTAQANKIFEDAKVDCQLMLKSDKPIKDYLEEYFSRKKYDSDEQVLFVNYCLMYAYGKRDSAQ